MGPNGTVRDPVGRKHYDPAHLFYSIFFLIVFSSSLLPSHSSLPLFFFSLIYYIQSFFLLSFSSFFSDSLLPFLSHFLFFLSSLPMCNFHPIKRSKNHKRSSHSGNRGIKLWKANSDGSEHDDYSNSDDYKRKTIKNKQETAASR